MTSNQNQRFVIAAEEKVERDPHFPVRVWAIDAETRLEALREARRLADQDPLTCRLPVRIVDGPGPEAGGGGT